MRRNAVSLVSLLVAAQLGAATVGAASLPSTREDFELPGTQPLTITDNISTPDNCAPCHSGFGQPNVEPLFNWQGSMMAQAGRDPLTFAALAVSNQDAPNSGETCLRCHMPKGWLEGRSFAADGTAMTADDRQGVQCSACHRLVDPRSGPGHPVEDAEILAALETPVPGFGGAMMVVDPFERMRGPFDIIADLGSDPHVPDRTTLVSPFHATGELCGTCHNLRNPIFTKNDATGEWELDPMGVANPDPTKGFPEQSTFDEWAASEYASTGVLAPQFGGNKAVVSTCQDCHMPDVTGRDANLGLTRDDIPFHGFAGANTFIPAVLPFHPAFGSEVNADALQAGIVRATAMLQKAATLSGTLEGGNLTIRITNESGHKLPTGYPEGRRMWLHVRALDERRNVVLESGRYVFSTATLDGHRAEPGEADHDPHLHVWEAEQGISEEVAAQVGLPAGRSFHLSLNNVRLKDNRIPPRGFTNAAFAAVDAEPVAAVFADGQYWDDVVYPVGAAATRAEVILYYQTTSREYVEFLLEENTTTASGNILFDLWDEHDKSTPVEMAKLTLESDSRSLAKCNKSVATSRAKYLKTYYKEWSRCFSPETKGLSCDEGSRDAKIADEAAKVRARVGGVKDRSCAGAGLTPGSLGHGSTCPAPCDDIVLFDMGDLADCGICVTAALVDASLDAAYGTAPPSFPAQLAPTALRCQRFLDKAAGRLAAGWTKALDKCEATNALGRNVPPVDCATDPDGRIARAQSKAASTVAACEAFDGLAGCATSGDSTTVAACIEAAIGSLVGPYTEVPYP